MKGLSGRVRPLSDDSAGATWWWALTLRTVRHIVMGRLNSLGCGVENGLGLRPGS